jgi:hypothetical protein
MKKLKNTQRAQQVMSHSADIVEQYVTKSGQTKNRYKYTNAPTVVKTIIHEE